MVKAPPAPQESFRIQQRRDPGVVISLKKETREKVSTFYHSGDLGDVIFSLPTVRALGGGIMLLGPHCNASPFITRELMTPERANLLIPLLKQQPYIKGAQYCPSEKAATIDLNKFRLTLAKSGPHENLAHLHLKHFGFPASEADKRWLQVDEPVIIKDRPVVITKTLRYDGLLDWHAVLRNYVGMCVFIGTPAEHAAFQERYGLVDYYPTKDLLEVARVIAGAELYISNQNGCHAIAEGLKQTLIQEPNSITHPAIFERPNAFYWMPPTYQFKEMPSVGPTKAEVTMEKRLKIDFRAALDGFSGIGQAATQLILGLLARGHDVEVIPTRTSEIYGKINEKLPLKTTATRGRLQVLFETVAFLPQYAHKDDLIITLWETTRWPSTAVEVMNRARAVFTTCAWNAETLRNSGCIAQVRVVPLGMEPAIFHPGTTRPKICTFGAAGRVAHGQERKGLDTVIAAFLQAFPWQQDVQLRLKIFKDCNIRSADNDRVIRDRTFMTREQLAEWHRGNTAFVSAARAEGFGLCLLEAMACGCAPIACRYGGQADFFDKSVGYEVEFKEEDTCPGVYAGMGKWAVPDIDSLICNMRRVYAFQKEAAELGLMASQKAANFSWENAVMALEKELLCTLLS